MGGALAALSLAAGCSNAGTAGNSTDSSRNGVPGNGASGNAAAGRATVGPTPGGCPVDRLRDRALAYAAGDVAGWDSAGEASGAVLTALGVSALRYEPLRCEDGAQWARLGYRITGFDDVPCELDQAWRLGGDGGLVRVGGPAAPWEWPGAQARRSPDSVVVATEQATPESASAGTAHPASAGTVRSAFAERVLSTSAGTVRSGPAGTAHRVAPAGRVLPMTSAGMASPRVPEGSGADRGAVRLAALVEDAASDLRAFWGEPRVRPVVFLPPDPDAFAALAAGVSHGASAVTVGPVRDGRAVGCDRVVLHPTVWAGLTPEGRRVVLTHELTHVAIRRDLRGPRPAWLVEGVCEYAAYRRSTLAPAQIARPLLEKLRGGTLPDDLPGEEDLAGPDPGWAYAAAWRACHVIVARAGEGSLLEAAREPGPGGLTRVLTDRLGWQLHDLVAAWRQDLAALARSARP